MIKVLIVSHLRFSFGICFITYYCRIALKIFYLELCEFFPLNLHLQMLIPYQILNCNIDYIQIQSIEIRFH